MNRARPILIAIDAFGTLFSPKSPIGQQYAAVAAQYGIVGLDSKAIASSFNTSYKRISKEFPNYGKDTRLSLEEWWRKVIAGSIQPHIKKDAQLSILHDKVVPALTNRFWCADGYSLHQDAMDLVRQVQNFRRAVEGQRPVVIGVLSNSDTRVADVLKAFGYRVAKLRITPDTLAASEPVDEVDFQFVVYSYDVGFEKPAKEIFDAAESLVRRVLMPTDRRDEHILKLYIGDEMAKDGIGARNAGWHSVVVKRNDTPLPHLHNFHQLLEDIDRIGLNEPTLIKEVCSLSSARK